MPHKILLSACAALLASLALSSEARAWGAYHVGYTHVGPAGDYHWGRTGAYGGGYDRYRYGGSHYGSYGYGGAYHYDGYHYGGYGYGGAYRYGYRRRW
jgi:hypothetical protein